MPFSFSSSRAEGVQFSHRFEAEAERMACKPGTYLPSSSAFRASINLG